MSIHCRGEVERKRGKRGRQGEKERKGRKERERTKMESMVAGHAFNVRTQETKVSLL